MFVIWTALRTPEPDSLHIPLTDTEVTGQLGEAGIAGRIDTHFWQRFGNALMLSTVQDVAAAAANSAPGKDRRTDYTENTRAASAEMAKVTLENSINIPPTMYLNQGDSIGIMTGADIDFSPIYQLRLKGTWQRHDAPITLSQCYAFASTLASWSEDNIDDVSPILSATLGSGERLQVLIPPACERNTVSITLRKPAFTQRPHQSYIDAGFYHRLAGKETMENKDDELAGYYRRGDIPHFLEKAVEYGKTLFIVGETGSGKTTYMKMLLDYIPLHLRLTTIEDNAEIRFYRHTNYVHLFYPADAGEDAIVTPGRLIRANYRMNPDRILLAEIRGREAWDALKIVGSGHEGLITSLHAGSPEDCIEGIIDRCYENPDCQNMPFDVLLRKVLNSIDIIVSVDIHGDIRRMGDIYFKPLHLKNMKDRFRRTKN